jgi:hypothetical protein
MKLRIVGLLALGLLAGPMAANATMVSWLLQGTFDTTPTGSDVVNSGINPQQGDSFSIILHFDTSTPPSNTGPAGTCSLAAAGGSGTLCRHNGASATVQYFSDLVVNGTAIPGYRFPELPDTYWNTITVRNDADVGGTLMDGYSWGTTTGCDNINIDCTEGAQRDSVGIIFRGSFLSMVTDSRLLPSDAPALLLSQQTRLFQLCSGIWTGGDNDCRFAYLEGTFNAVSQVPEPGTLALLGLGVAGLGATRRRKMF